MNKLQNFFSTLFILCAAAFFSTAAVNAQTTSFTYQGKLSDNSVAANGSYNMQFALCALPSGGGCQSLQAVSNVAVTNGIFTVNLDFGNAFDGGDKYLQISVAPTGNNNYAALAPRQRITSVPYAIKSLNSGTAETANTANTATNSIQLGGVDSSQYVLTTDPRLNQTPGGSGSYIQNSLSVQANASFNISGSGTTGSSFSALAVNSTTGYGIGGNRVLSVGGTNNVFVGVGAGTGNTGNSNSFFGNNAGNQNSGSFNAFFGHNAGEKNTGQQNDFFGDSAGYNNTTGKQNSFFGDSAGFANTIGNSNAFFGSYAGTANTTGTGNAFFGMDSGKSNTTAASNSFFGNAAGQANTTGGFNAFFGHNAGQNNTTGKQNNFFGDSAGLSNTTGNSNSFFGDSAGFANNAKENSFFGFKAGTANTTGRDNAFFGTQAGQANINGIENTFVGTFSGLTNTTGNGNVFLGEDAGISNTTGSGNTFVGHSGGGSNFNGNNNTVIGNQANILSAAIVNHSTAVGADAIAEKSNTIMLGTTSDIVVVPFEITIGQLGGAGIKQLCLNSNNYVSDCSSSLRYKTNIAPFNSGLNLVRQLRPITFDWKDGGTHDLGFGAEDVAKVEPLLTIQNAKGEVEGVKYDRISAALVNAVKEQQTQIETQQKQIQQQQFVIDGLRKLVCAQNPNSEICKENK